MRKSYLRYLFSLCPIACFLRDTTLPLIFFIKSDLVKPPEVLDALPLYTWRFDPTPDLEPVTLLLRTVLDPAVVLRLIVFGLLLDTVLRLVLEPALTLDVFDPGIIHLYENKI